MSRYIAAAAAVSLCMAVQYTLGLNNSRVGMEKTSSGISRCDVKQICERYQCMAP